MTGKTHGLRYQIFDQLTNNWEKLSVYRASAAYPANPTYPAYLTYPRPTARNAPVVQGFRNYGKSASRISWNHEIVEITKKIYNVWMILHRPRRLGKLGRRGTQREVSSQVDLGKDLITQPMCFLPGRPQQVGPISACVRTRPKQIGEPRQNEQGGTNHMCFASHSSSFMLKSFTITVFSQLFQLFHGFKKVPDAALP